MVTNQFQKMREKQEPQTPRLSTCKTAGWRREAGWRGREAGVTDGRKDHEFA